MCLCRAQVRLIRTDDTGPFWTPEPSSRRLSSRPGILGISLRPLIWTAFALDDEYVSVPIGGHWHFIRTMDGHSYTHVGTAQMRYTRSGGQEETAVAGPSIVRRHGDHLLCINPICVPHFTLSVYAGCGHIAVASIGLQPPVSLRWFGSPSLGAKRKHLIPNSCSP